MEYKAKILADSITVRGHRLTTLELTYPRIIHAEMMTHRDKSRNAGSSRAIPSKKLRGSVNETPFIPTYWGKNQPGMKAREELQGWRRWAAIKLWILTSKMVVFIAWLFDLLGVHKQLANRILEPFQWYTAIFSGTEWSNFFALRNHPDAQPEIQEIAKLMYEEMQKSIPQVLREGDWHLPLVKGLDLDRLVDEGYEMVDIKKISAGRCARVSYLTHFGVRDPHKDIELCETLVKDGHMSPLEHVATPTEGDEFYGNYRGWLQMRKQIPNEHDFSKRAQA